MADRRLLALLCAALSFPGAAHALPPLPGIGLAIARALRSTASRARAEAVTPLGAVPAAVLEIAPPPSTDGHLDLDDVVRRRMGGRVTYYFGRNLAQGDITAVKTAGIKFLFD